MRGELKPYQSHAVRIAGMRVMGKLHVILQAETNGATLGKLREAVKEIRVRTEDLNEMLDKMEEENEGVCRRKNNGAHA